MQTHHEDHEDIFTAVRSGDVDEVAAILSIDNRLTRVADESGATPLHLAAGLGHRGVVETLLANNADPNAPDGRGETALAHAERAGHADVARLLRENGAR